MFICENLEMDYFAKSYSMVTSREPWESIAKWVVNNEGFPRQWIYNRGFRDCDMGKSLAEHANFNDLSTECANRFDWYGRWSFEELRHIGSESNCTSSAMTNETALQSISSCSTADAEIGAQTFTMGNRIETVEHSDSLRIVSPPPRPWTPEGDHEDLDPFADHAIPSNQCAQKIPSMLDLDVNPNSSGNQYNCLL